MSLKKEHSRYDSGVHLVAQTLCGYLPAEKQSLVCARLQNHCKQKMQSCLLHTRGSC